MTAFNPAAHLIWWVGGVILAVLAVFLLLDLVQAIRQRRSYAKWLREEGDGEAPSDLAKPGPFRVREYLRWLRVRFVRRIRSGFSSTRSRGLGQPPWKAPDEWSPLDTRPGKHESK